MPPRLNVITFPTRLQAPCDVEAETKSMPAGKVLVTNRPVTGSGPGLATPMEYVRLLPTFTDAGAVTVIAVSFCRQHVAFWLTTMLSTNQPLEPTLPSVVKCQRIRTLAPTVELGKFATVVM